MSSVALRASMSACDCCRLLIACWTSLGLFFAELRLADLELAGELVHRPRGLPERRESLRDRLAVCLQMLLVLSFGQLTSPAPTAAAAASATSRNQRKRQ